MNEWLIRRFVKNHDDVGNPAVRTAYGKLASITGILCNALLSAAKAAIGLITGSISIVADAMNNLSAVPQTMSIPTATVASSTSRALP